MHFPFAGADPFPMTQGHLDRRSLAPIRPERLRVVLACCAWLSLIATTASAAPGDILFGDDFESGFGQWTTTDVTLSGVNTMTFASPLNSLYVRGDTVQTMTVPIDTRVPNLRVTATIQRGSDLFSEDPDTGDDLRIEYLDSGGSWELIQSYLGSGTKGEIIALDQTLGGDALHAGFRLRVHLVNGSGGPPDNRGLGWDYWHVDDVEITEIAAPTTFDLGYCEEFENGLPNWTVAGSPGSATTTTQTANTLPRSLAVFGGATTITSNPIDLSSAADVGASLWVRRGDDSFSEDPDSNEDLFVEYLDDTGSWITLASYVGDGSPGEIFTPDFSLPASAEHANFRLRVRMTGRDGVPYDYWHVDSICMTGTRLAAEWRFEEYSWNGTAGEVVDSSGNGHDGTAVGDGTTSLSTPALPGNPGTCSYGVFDGAGDGVDIPHDDALNGLGSLTYTAWVNPSRTDGLRHVFGKNVALSSAQLSQMGLLIFDGTLLAGAMTSDGARVITAPSPVVDRWTHVALVFDGASLLLYLDGAVAGSMSFLPTTLVQSTNPLAIGKEPESTDRGFAGFIDEVRVYQSPLDAGQVDTVMNETRPCEIFPVDFLVEHDGNGVHCTPEPIRVTARHDNGDPFTDYTDTITLDTQAGRGTWTLQSGSGSLVDATADDGLATYTFDPADQGQAEFLLDYAGATSAIDIDAYTDAFRDDDSEGNLVYSPGTFVVTENAVPDPPPATIDDPVGTQTAGIPFEIHLTAYSAACGTVDTYAGPKTIRFWLDHDDPAGGPLVPTIDGSPIATDEASSIGQSVTFTAGRGVVLAKYKDVGRITIQAQDASTATPITGSTGGFVVRPADFVITSIENASNTPNPGTTTPTDTHWARAGEAFTLTVEARDAEGSLTPSYGTESSAEGLRVSSAGLVAPAGGRNGTLDDGQIGNDTAFVPVAPAGRFSGSTFSFDEVGAIRLRVGVADGDYMGTGDVLGTESGPVGRFAPFAFEMTANTPRFETGCTLGAFTWIGEPFHYVSGEEAVMTVRAVNAAGTTTTNYAGDWFRLTNSTLENRAYAVGSSTLDESGLPTTSDDPVIASNDDGTGTLTFGTGSGLAVVRGAPVVPFYAEIELGLDIIDADDTRFAGNPFTIGGTTTGSGIDFDASKRFQYGRVAIENAHGSELSDLPVRLRTQRFTGISFADDTNDSCTQIPVSAIVLTPSPNSLTSTATVANDPVSGGNAGLVLGAPGLVGTIDIHVDLGPTGANLPWLRFDWPDDGNLDGAVDDDPRARATFGIWEGRDGLIFQREVY